MEFTVKLAGGSSRHFSECTYLITDEGILKVRRKNPDGMGGGDQDVVTYSSVGWLSVEPTAEVSEHVP